VPFFSWKAWPRVRVVAQWWEHSLPTATVARVKSGLGVDPTCGLSLLLVPSCAPRGFSLGHSGFTLTSKPTGSNSDSIGKARTRLIVFLRTRKCFVITQDKKQQFTFILYFRGSATLVFFVNFIEVRVVHVAWTCIIHHYFVVKRPEIFYSCRS